MYRCKSIFRQTEGPGRMHRRLSTVGLWRKDWAQGNVGEGRPSARRAFSLISAV